MYSIHFSARSLFLLSAQSAAASLQRMLPSSGTVEAKFLWPAPIMVISMSPVGRHPGILVDQAH